MEEQLLQFIWHRKLFDDRDLCTTSDDPVEILHPGTPNTDQGPDFLHSMIRIGQQVWAGHVEIHIHSSAWFMHLHDKDSHYNNVILHVVWEEDRPAMTNDGYKLPCIELGKRVDKALLDRYRSLMNNQEWVSCASALEGLSPIMRHAWLDRMMAERLESKAGIIHRLLDKTAGDQEQAFYVLLARQLGAPANGDAMEELGLRLPLKLLRKHRDRIDQVEALLFGAAGMLGKEISEPYCQHLYREFHFLQRKYGLQPMPALHWKFMRMRPQHFPTIRIAQLASMLFQKDQFISLLEQDLDSAQWMEVFMVTPHHSFWETHYHFTAATPATSKRLGKETATSLIINVVAPFMFVYGKLQGMAHLKEKALRLLEELPAEQNAITRGWQQCGWSAEDAGRTQGLLHLKKMYCDHRRCLHCAVGLQIIK